MMKKRRIMFVTYGAGHVDIVAHLLPAIATQGLPEPVVLALTTAPLRLSDSACTLRCCADYLPMNGYEEALSKGAALAEKFWTRGSDVSWEETCAYLGVSMCDLETSEGRVRAQKLYEDLGRKAFCPVRFMERVLEQERPDIIVTTCHVRMERAAIIAARNLGIRSVLIEDLLGYSLLGPYPYGEAGTLIDPDEWPDMTVVMNSAVKDIIVQNGFPDYKVTPLGQPVFSKWKEQYSKAQSLALFRENSNDKPLVTYVAPARYDILASQSQVWIEMARRRTDLNFAIKLHPSTVEQDYRHLYGPLPDNTCILSKEPILNVIKTSDLVVLFRSTVGILCLTSATPMIVWDTTGEPELLPYATSGAAKLVRANDEIEPQINDMLQYGTTSELSLPHPLFRIPANATEQITKWLAAGALECTSNSI